VTIDCVAGEAFDGFHVAARGEVLEGPDADVTRCDAGQCGPGQLAVAENSFAGCGGCQRPGGRNSERMHCFTNEIFAQDWPQCGAAIPPPGEGRSARAL
jgi:hypothetical protein